MPVTVKRWLRRAALTIAIALPVQLRAARVTAAEPVPTVTYTALEQDIIRQELERSGGRLDSNPRGKIISRIDVVRMEVFDDRDPVPDFLNIFHGTTREWVIRKQLLFREGQVYLQSRVDQTARNFRALRQLSLVLIVPIDDGDPERVRVLVITKDVWSLRLNSDIEVANGSLNYLLLNPSEENLFGTHVSVGGLFLLEPYTYSVGGVLRYNRVLGSRFSAAASYNLVFNRDTGSTEGFYGNFAYALPLYSVEQKWGFTTGIAFANQLGRVVPSGTDRIFVYDLERYAGGLEIVRSFGRSKKFDVSWGIEADWRTYRPRIPSDVSPELARRVTEELPRSDTRFSPFFGFAGYENRFLKTIELETLGLQEDFRLGYEVLLRVYPASTRMISSRDLFGVISGLAYTQPVGDGFVRGIAKSTIEVAKESKHQTITSVALRFASPRLGLGRLIIDSQLAAIGFNPLNRFYAVGGGDRLRGYPLGDLQLAGGAGQRGPYVFALNTEFRTRGIDILSAQCGLAVFHDLADAGDSFGRLDLKNSVGLGVRILFPQVGREVLRFDWALPLHRGYAPLPGSVFLTFRQAFPLSGLAPPQLTSGSFE